MWFLPNFFFFGYLFIDESVESDVYDDSYSISSLNDLDDNPLSVDEKASPESLMPRRVFNEDGKPLGMFPENQAKTMCVDVVSVYSPPVADSNFNELMNRSPSPASSNADETSSITSSASSSSYSINNDHADDDFAAANHHSNDAAFNEYDDNTFDDSGVLEIGSDSKEATKESSHNTAEENLYAKKQVKGDSKSSTAATTPVNKAYSRIDPTKSGEASDKVADLKRDHKKSSGSGSQTPTSGGGNAYTFIKLENKMK